MNKTVSIEWLKSDAKFIFPKDKNQTTWLCTYKQSIVGGEYDGMYLINYENKRNKTTCEQYISRNARVILKQNKVK